jgi:2-amino-4-hydroxy-6-hydroxymethyldihydropteridine diphosphokinase
MQQLLLVGLGSNLHDYLGQTPLQICRKAVSLLCAAREITFHSMSRWYRTAPIPASDQPDYINGVVRLTTTLSPDDVLEYMNKIEVKAGRTRMLPNAARVLDLDLLVVDSLVLNTPHLTIPHPRLAERAFVLHPLCDVAPDWRHPLLGETALTLRDRLRPQRIVPIPSEVLPSHPPAPR